MQFLSWAQKKLLHNGSPGKKQLHAYADANYRDTSVQSNVSHQRRSRLKNIRNEQNSAIQMGYAAESLRVPETRSRPTLQQFFQQDELCHVELQSAPNRSETHPGLLTISSLGVGDFLGKQEVREMDSKNASAGLDEVSPVDTLKIQEELQKVLYMSDRRQLQNDFALSDIKVPRNSVKSHVGEREHTEKQVFPLQKFLEIPLIVERSPRVAKKKRAFVQGLSSLFSSAALSQRFLHQKAKETAKRIRICPFLLEKLLKFHSSDSGHPPRYGSKLNKFLQLSRKKGAIFHKGNLKVDSKGNDNGTVKSSKGRGNVSSTYADQLPEEHHLVDRFDAFEIRGCSDVSQHTCHWLLDLDDVQVLKTGNEYWIKTDDEYLILEV